MTTSKPRPITDTERRRRWSWKLLEMRVVLDALLAGRNWRRDLAIWRNLRRKAARA